jgi:hypothetical protein
MGEGIPPKAKKIFHRKFTHKLAKPNPGLKELRQYLS